MAEGDIIIIDGSLLEGGGQILRNSVSLAAILKRPVVINNIRGGRNPPGLGQQHLTGLLLIDEICGRGSMRGVNKGAVEISFRPSRITAGAYLGDTKTAGSICLLAQIAVPVLLFGGGPSRLNLRGGTDAAFAPPFDFFTEVFAPAVRKFGIEVDFHLVRRGFFPKGGGEVHVEVRPVSCLQAVDLTSRGAITKVKGKAYVARLNDRIAREMRDAALETLKSQVPSGCPIEIEVVREQAPDRCFASGIILVAETASGCPLSASRLGDRKESPRDTGKTVAQQLLTDLAHEGCCDEHLQDQVLIFMALAEGRSRVRCGPLTLHSRTALHVIESLTGVRFEIGSKESGGQEVSCEGLGLRNTQLTT